MLFSLLMLASTPTYAPIYIGKFDPAEFPNAQKVERRMPHADLNNRVEKIPDTITVLGRDLVDRIESELIELEHTAA